MQIFQNTLYQIIMKVISAGSMLVITILIANYFGSDGYGSYVKITTFIGLFYLVTDLGLNAVYLQKETNYLRFHGFLYLRIFIACVLTVVAIILAQFLPGSSQFQFGFSDDERFGLIVFSFTIISQAIVFSAAAIFQKWLRYHLLMKANILGSLVTLILVSVSVWLLLPLWVVLTCFVIGGFVSAIASLLFTKETIISSIIDYKSMISLVKESLPLGVMLIFSFVYFRTDIFLLSFLRPTAEVGVYGLSTKLFEFLLTLPLFLSNSLYPILLKEKNFDEFFKKVKYYSLYFLLAGIAIAIVLWPLAIYIPFIKEDFAASIAPFRLLLISLPLFFLTNIFQWALITQKQQWYLLWVYGFVTIINILLNLFFIPVYSYYASAIITGILEGVVLLLLLGKLLRLRNIKQSTS